MGFKGIQDFSKDGRIVIAALFPGQGSQAIGMAKDFYDNSPAAKAVLDQAEAAMPGLLKLMFEGPEDSLKLTAHQQPALVAAASAAFAAYKEAGGAMPSYTAGHSLGEFSAHVAAGSLEIADAIKLVNKRGQYMQEAVPQGEGAMSAVMKTDQATIAKVCESTEGVVEIANLNSDGQIVISGSAAAVGVANDALKEAGARVVPLPVSAPFHCSLMKPAAESLAKDLAAIDFSAMAIPVLANVTADVIASENDIAKLLEEQVTGAVRWIELTQKLDALGVTKYIEFGSGKVLTGLMKRNVKGSDAASVTDMASLAAVLNQEVEG